MIISKILPIICCLLGFIPCFLSQSIAISVSPDVIFLDSDVDITCQLAGNAVALLSLVPFYVINGTYIQHSCLGSTEFQPLTQRFSTLPPNNSDNNTLLTRFSISPVSQTDMDLSIGCVFYDLKTANNFSSQVITLSVSNTSQPIAISTVEITTTVQITEAPFINSQEFYFTVGGTVGGFLVLVIVITILIVLIISAVVVVTKRNKRSEVREERVERDISPPIPIVTDDNPSTLVAKKEDDPRDRLDSVKTYNESEAQRYSALPTYSLAVNMHREEFTESTDPSAAHRFSGIDIIKEKQETDS